MPLALPDVTLCAADCVTPGLAARALDISTGHCAFAEAILFSDVAVAGRFRTVKIDRLTSKKDYSRFVLEDLRAHIATPFVLVAQWDGYVVDPGMWRAAYLQYDYIGARFQPEPGGVPVGNGGFSLRSRRLLDALAEPGFILSAEYPEDDLICRINRGFLESKGIRIAPPEVAEQFSYEWVPPPGPTFGFHGLTNMWRHVSDADMADLVAHFTPQMIRTRLFMALVATYFSLQRGVPFKALYRAARRVASPQDLAPLLASVTRHPEQALAHLLSWDQALGITPEGSQQRRPE